MKQKQMIVVALFLICVLLVTAGVYFLVPEDAETLSQDAEVRLPVVMYHSVVQSGKSGKYVITTQTLENDLKYIQEKGYQTVVVADLIAYVEQGVPLPEKAIMLTFDDGFYNTYAYVLPLLEQYDMKAVVAVVGAYTEKSVKEADLNPAYAYMDWDTIRKAQESGRIEIQSHSYDMHNYQGRYGATKKKGEDDAAFRAALTADLEKMQTLLTQNSGVTPTAYVYPLGAICNGAEDVMREVGFRATFSCYEKINYISRDPQTLFCLGRYNRPAGIATAQFFKQLIL